MSKKRPTSKRTDDPKKLVVKAAPEHSLTENLKIIGCHFVETLAVVGLELLLQYGLILCKPYLDGNTDIVDITKLFSKWFVIAAFVNFGTGSVVRLAANNLVLFREVILPRKGSIEDVGD